MRIAVTVTLAIVTVFVLQRIIAKENAMTRMDCTVARVAERYVATHYPTFDTIKDLPLIHDKGDTWEVEYEIPSGTIGGTPVVVIEKATLKVLRASHTQ